MIVKDLKKEKKVAYIKCAMENIGVIVLSLVKFLLTGNLAVVVFNLVAFLLTLFICVSQEEAKKKGKWKMKIIFQENSFVAKLLIAIVWSIITLPIAYIWIYIKGINIFPTKIYLDIMKESMEPLASMLVIDFIKSRKTWKKLENETKEDDCDRS